MGWLAAQGAIMAIGLFIGLVCSVIGLFFGHIILFDSIALGIAAGVCCNQFTAIHPALCMIKKNSSQTFFSAYPLIRNCHSGNAFWVLPSFS